MRHLFGCASDSSKSTCNQDFCVTVSNELLGFTGVIVADGIGSHFRSEIAAKFCCNYLKRLLEYMDEMDQLDWNDLFHQVKAGLIQYARRSEEFIFDELDKNSSLSTTLICALSTGTEYIISYVGNGSAWFIDGRFNEFATSFYLPWNSINLLNPHCVEEDGKPALYRYISIDENINSSPTVIKLNKNRFEPGEIIMIATDGFYSNDAVPIGKDEQGTLWIKGEASLPLFYEYLSEFLWTSLDDSSNKDLELLIAEFLQAMKDKFLMTDDTTVGIIISEKALQYQQQKLALQHEKNYD